MTRCIYECRGCAEPSTERPVSVGFSEIGRIDGVSQGVEMYCLPGAEESSRKVISDQTVMPRVRCFSCQYGRLAKLRRIGDMLSLSHILRQRFTTQVDRTLFQSQKRPKLRCLIFA